ncbi:MAG: SIS domain-containing protein [Treponema sp.]|uniref:SIS domain-containing protein n=1 Tax=uncultured Treponema sp. TaxID=162155 RepID=UPI0025DB3456|nr:SIS domain-containing protein [uncultured Treponema sp.]MBR4600443.1 SIS domain-containing protein [Treponema sp.]
MSKEIEAIKNFIEISKKETDEFLSNVDLASVEKAAKLIIEAKKRGNRLHISGIGKPAHIAGYAASVISSTGTPAYFLHGTEAVHGSCGQLVAGDIVIMISNSGETAEMKATVNAIKNNGCQIIGVSGKSESWLAKESAAFLFAGVKEEGGPLNRAPRMSIIAETFILQILSLYLQMDYDLDPKQYVKWHPGGSLGHLRENEK